MSFAHKGPRRLYLAVIMPWGVGGWSRLYEGDKKKFKLKISQRKLHRLIAMGPIWSCMMLAGRDWCCANY